MSYRADALARLDVRAFYAAHGVEPGARVGADEYRFRCPFHDDREPSANVNLSSGLWKCQAENTGGGPVDFLMLLRGLSARDALEQVGEFAGLGPMQCYNGAGKRDINPHQPGTANSAQVSQPRLNAKLVEAWHEAALRNAELMRWFSEKRGFTDDTIRRWQLGWDGDRVTIPIHDEAGKLVNVRRYKRDSGVAGKMIGYAGNNEMRLWPLPLPATDVLLVEGEWDAILARQQGFENAVTVTSGAGNFNSRWVPLFAGHTVTIAYDNDEAGRRGAQKVAASIALAEPPASVFILQIPNLPDKGDVTDFFVEQGRTADELRTLILDATPYIVARASAADEQTAIEVPLYKASDARYQGKRMATRVLLSGKAMTPYTVPLRARVHCDMGNKRFCGICPLAARAGDREIVLSASNPSVLSLVGVSDEAKGKALRAIAEAVPQCNRPQVEVHEWTNIEELRLIPELDRAQDADAEYVARRAFLIGHGTAPNRGYIVDGYAHAHPKDQSTVHLLSNAEPAQDNISAFTMTPELHESLKIFHAGEDVEGRWRSIYDDYRTHVHRIQDRLDMQVAFDLAWHSVIGFSFNGQAVRRGWVEALVMSDSGQGKTEMAEHLRAHYQLGDRVQSEQSSTAGLLGGLEKMGDTWILGWGRIPQNDKRLLIVDEAQGLNPAIVEGLSDVRATGVAEITKIRTERTNARCRIVWLANPVSGLTLSQHNQGVLAIRDLFKKPEDVRRLDLAICLASGDVDYARAINVRHAADTHEPRYGSDLSRALILWAWSRRPDQVVFSEDATGLILAEATAMGRRYHPSIPLVEPSDQRLKLARLAAAAAARVYSTPDGEHLRVEVEHVGFVATYLERIYTARAMAYGEYSAQVRRGETLDPGEVDNVKGTIEQWLNADEASTFFRQAKVFKRSELEDVLGWDADEAKRNIRFLTSSRLIIPTREGYRKTAAFITLLRDLNLNPAATADVDAILEGAKF